MADSASFVRRVRTNPSAVLLGAQLLAVLLYPYLSDSVTGRIGLGVVGMLVVLLALRTLRWTPADNLMAFGLAIPALVFTVLDAVWSSNDVIGLISAVLHVLFYFYVTYGLLRYLFGDDDVTADDLFAVGATFTVVAWGFAYLFLSLHIIDSGAFTSASEVTGPRGFFELLFLSFTTLTATGLSDIGPATAPARSLVMIEQFAGVMYVALVVARLVGLTLFRRRS